MKYKLTKKKIEDAKPNSIMYDGITTDDPNGLNMTNSGRILRFIVYRGGIADWCIYTHLAEMPLEYIRDHGDKPHSREFIENEVEFDDKVWEMYRH